MERGRNVSNAQYKYSIYCSTRGCTAFVLYLSEQYNNDATHISELYDENFNMFCTPRLYSMVIV